MRIPESVKSLLVESGILLRIGIQNPISTDKESWIQYLESGIHGMESRIQDFRGFLYMERIFQWHGPKSLREEGP